MKIFKPSMFFMIGVMTLACTDSKREEQLTNREQTLIKKETEFATKQAEYQSLMRMRDSLFSLKDSVVLQKWSEGTEGIWNGKTVCRESDCSDYVVGDQRSDIWEFTSDSTGIFTKIISNGKLIRIYSASADSTEYRLSYQTDSTANRKVSMNVVLKPVSRNLIKGTQTINVNDNCTARFSVELVRTSNP